MRERVLAHLRVLYPDADHESLTDAAIAAVGIEKMPRKIPSQRRWRADDVVLITYANTIHEIGRPPLQSLLRFLRDRLRGVVTGVHVLPFAPWSSDDGFAVVDYAAVDPAVGAWDDIESLAGEFTLMVDVVLNHVSAESEWFRQFVEGESPGADYILTGDPGADLHDVVRPRTSPLLRPVETTDGLKHVWCTFSHDQVDVDFSNPDVLLEYLRIVDNFVARGARILRLDAVAYAWKSPGTSCIHLPEVHELVKLLRTLLAVREPTAAIVTETNVPSAENLAYFGDGDEAHMVYNFPLAPLLVDAVLSGDASTLSAWLGDHPPVPEGCTFVNFLATHDGIGVRPVEGLLPPGHLNALVASAELSGGRWSAYATPVGPRPYELNVSLFDLLGPERIVCAHTALLALAGVPAIYVHSLLATPAATELVERTGHNRSINRARLGRSALERLLDDHTSVVAEVFTELSRRIRARASHAAFAPDASQEVVDSGKRVLAVRRQAPGRPPVLCLHNLSDGTEVVDVTDAPTVDLLSGVDVGAGPLELEPYGCVWLASF